MNSSIRYILSLPIRVAAASTILSTFFSILLVILQKTASKELAIALLQLEAIAILSTLIAALPILLNCITIVRKNIVLCIISFFVLPLIVLLMLGANEIVLFCFLVPLFYYFKQVRRYRKTNNDK